MARLQEHALPLLEGRFFPANRASLVGDGLWNCNVDSNLLQSS
jgi:hypothetical protein